MIASVRNTAVSAVKRVHPTMVMTTRGATAAAAQSAPGLVSNEDKAFWDSNSYLLAPGLAADVVSDLRRYAEEVANMPPRANAHLQHWELNNKGERVFCRAENFVNFHDGWSSFAHGDVKTMCGKLFGELGDAVLFKEKINFKRPGGAGFNAHQDSPAYISMARDHISVMVALDDATIENGAVQVAPGQYGPGDVELTPDGVVADDTGMEWRTVEAKAGDVMFFSGYIPHRSGANTTSNPRRAVFLTYNPASQGDHHEEYYRQKHQAALGFKTDTTISFQGDFQGTVVA